MSIKTISTQSDIHDIAMADKDETSKFFKRPPKKAVKPRKTPAPTTTQKEKKEEAANIFKKKEETTTPTEEKNKNSSTQERRVIKEMLKEQGKDTVDAINKMASAMIEKMSEMMAPKTDLPTIRNLPNSADILMEDVRQKSIMDEINEVEPWIQEERLQKLKNHQNNVLQASLNLEEELDAAQGMERQKCIDNTRGNIIKMLTENITKLEARIQALETKDRTKDTILKDITEKINKNQTNLNTEQQIPPTQKTDATIPPKILKDNIDQDGFIRIENKKRKVIPLSISPGAGPAADSRILSPITYAKIHLNQKKHKPMENFPDELLDTTKTTDNPDDDIDSAPNKLDKEQKKY